MPAVLVHGNPETPAIWGPTRSLLSRPDVIALQLPGFGRPAPAGFDATHTSYVAWLRAEIESMDEPVDLVGHDWGGALVVELVIDSPELVRTWASDVLGLFDPAYTWHDMAQVWQTEGAGEEAVDAMAAASPADRTLFYESVGMSAEVAAELAEAFDEEMGRCVLALYRSARQPAMSDIGRRLAAASAAPGLAIVATADPYTGGDELAVRAAGVAGARVERIDGGGHWWMLEDPARAAELLERFWQAGPPVTA
ncbi:MAG: alpha/beta fold hydrolase [Acidimicrobiales bacterium]